MPSSQRDISNYSHNVVVLMCNIKVADLCLTLPCQLSDTTDSPLPNISATCRRHLFNSNAPVGVGTLISHPPIYTIPSLRHVPICPWFTPFRSYLIVSESNLQLLLSHDILCYLYHVQEVETGLLFDTLVGKSEDCSLLSTKFVNLCFLSYDSYDATQKYF